MPSLLHGAMDKVWSSNGGGRAAIARWGIAAPHPQAGSIERASDTRDPSLRRFSACSPNSRRHKFSEISLAPNSCRNPLQLSADGKQPRRRTLRLITPRFLSSSGSIYGFSRFGFRYENGNRKFRFSHFAKFRREYFVR